MPQPRSGRRREPQPAAEQAQAPDWLDQLVDEIYTRMEEGERPALSFLLERLLDKVMERERERFLQSPEGQGEQPPGFALRGQANGFYPPRPPPHPRPPQPQGPQGPLCQVLLP